MKVVLFCGGLGTRAEDYSERIPKPLVEVASRPILLHLMRYYAHFGHRDFILCLGHGAPAIKDFFLGYNLASSSDFALADGKTVELLERDIQDWQITLVETDPYANIGERLLAVRRLLEGDEMFLANYADALSDLDLDAYLQHFRVRDKIACFMSVPAPHTFHIVHSDAAQHAVRFELVRQSPMRINGGFFALRTAIFEYLKPGEDLVLEPFQRLMALKQLLAVPHDGFWQSMDTFKDKIHLDESC